jgi:hypothetical protein
MVKMVLKDGTKEIKGVCYANLNFNFEAKVSL